MRPHGEGEVLSVFRYNVHDYGRRRFMPRVARDVSWRSACKRDGDKREGSFQKDLRRSTNRTQ